MINVEPKVVTSWQKLRKAEEAGVVFARTQKTLTKNVAISFQSPNDDDRHMLNTLSTDANSSLGESRDCRKVGTRDGKDKLKVIRSGNYRLR